METELLGKVELLAYKKVKIYKQSLSRYILRAVLASMFIGFGVMVAFKTGNYFYLAESPFAYPAAALTFSTAIILISYAGGDLFTGNTFYFTYATFRKKMKWSQTFKLWGLTYLGNLIGAAVFALIILGTQLFADESASAMLMSTAAKKLHAPTIEIFFKAILCNWLVCLAFFIPLGMKNDSAKIMLMMMLVFSFFISGYEHSIANMSIFAIALISQPIGAITASEIFHNLIPATVGNLIGGVVFMACLYYYLNKPFLTESEDLK